MKSIIFLTILFISLSAIAQKDNDKQIIVTVTDTTGLYEKIRLSLVRNDFMIKDLGLKDTLVTYPRQFKQMSGYAIATVVINGSEVIYTGSYGLMRLDDWGYFNAPKKYKPISYFKTSKGWKVLMQSVNRLLHTVEGTITYSK